MQYLRHVVMVIVANATRLLLQREELPRRYRGGGTTVQGPDGCVAQTLLVSGPGRTVRWGYQGYWFCNCYLKETQF